MIHNLDGELHLQYVLHSTTSKTVLHRFHHNSQHMLHEEYAYMRTLKKESF